MSTKLSTLYEQLNDAIYNNNISLPNSKVTEIEVADFLRDLLKIRSSKISLKKASVTIDKAKTTIKLSGSWTAFGVTFSVTWTFKDSGKDGIEWSFDASTKDTQDINTVVNYFLQEVERIPAHIAKLDLTKLALSASINSKTRDYEVDLTGTTRLGSAGLIVKDTGGKYGAAFGVKLPDGFRLELLVDELSIFDELDFKNTAVIIADFEDKNSKLVGIKGIKKGIEFRSTLSLTAPSSTSILSKIVEELAKGLKGIPIEVSLDLSSTSKFTLEAMIDKSFGMPGFDSLKFSGVDFKLDTSPAASLAGTLAIPIKIPANPTVNSFKVTGAISYAEKDGTETIEGTMNSDTVIKEPFNVHGFTLKDVGFGIEASFGVETGVGVILEGDFVLGTQQLEEKFVIAMDFDDDLPNPSLLYVDAKNLSLATIFEAVIAANATLPDVLKDLKFSDLSFYWCDKAQSMPDGTKCEPGVGYNAALDLWGFDTYSALMIKQGSGIVGQASIDPIHLLDGKISVTGTGKTGHGVKEGGAYFDFDTTKSTFDASLDANIFGLTEKVDAHISKDSFLISLDSNLKYFKNDVDVYFKSLTDMRFNEKIEVDINVSPTVKLGNYTIGTIHVDSTLKGAISVFVSDSTYTAKVSGNFSWNDYSFKFNFDLAEDLSKLSDLAHAIEQKILSEATSIFSDYFRKVEHYISTFVKGLLKGGDFVLNVLYNVYNYTTSQLVAFMENLDSGIHIDGNPDFKIDINVRIPSISKHFDFGHVDTPHHDGHFPVWGHTDIPPIHGDVRIGTTVSTPALDIPLMDCDVGGHVDLKMPPTVHADASTPNIHVDEHFDLGVGAVSIGGGGKVGIDSMVGLDDLDLKAKLNINAHAGGSISHIGHFDQNVHADTEVP